MIKKILFLLTTLFLFTNIFSVVVVEQSCSFTIDSYERIDKSFNTFKISNFQDIEKVEKIEVKIEDACNSENKILTKITSFENGEIKIKNINPFTRTGIYNLQLKFILKDKIISDTKFNRSFVYFSKDYSPISPLIENKKFIKNTNEEFKIYFQNDKNYFLNIEKNSIQYKLNSENWKNLNINENDKFTLNLDQGLNYIEYRTYNFYSKKYSNINKKIVYVGNYDLFSKNLNVANSVNLNINPNQKDRVLYVNGNTKENSLLYINGIKTISDKNGNFGAFILLNDDLNNIEILNKNFISIKNISNINFQNKNKNYYFYDLNIPKISKTKNIKLNGKVKKNKKFFIYVNGEKNEIIPISNSFSTNINLNLKKNFVSLVLDNYVVENKIIYYDNESPKIKILSNSKQTLRNNNFLKFEISDDVGLNLQTLKVNNFEKENIKYNEMENNYYVENINSGNYEISIEDLVGNKITKSQNIELVENGNLIGKAIFENGFEENSNIILKYDKNNNIYFSMSNDFIFDKIYIDDYLFSNYKIQKSQNNFRVFLNGINFIKNNGTIKFEIYNNQKQVQEEKIFNYIFNKKPILEIDFFEISEISNKNSIHLKGKIIDENFIKSSLKINGKSEEILFYGNGFEAFLNIDDLIRTSGIGIQITGIDKLGNKINEFYSGINNRDLHLISNNLYSNTEEYNLSDYSYNLLKNNNDDVRTNFENKLLGFYSNDFYNIVYDELKFFLPQIQGISNGRSNFRTSSKLNIKNDLILNIDFLKTTNLFYKFFK